MIRFEHLRNAIDAVSDQDPEIGYALGELMSANRIGLPADSGEDEAEPCFLFEGERVQVRKVSFFNHGTAPLEERLVLKYGEIAEKHRIEAAADHPDYFQAVKQVQKAGLDCLVRFELSRVLAGLEKRLETFSGSEEYRRSLESRKKDLYAILQDSSSAPQMDENHPGIHYRAEIDTNAWAQFLRFPFSFEALRQVAEMNLEFFHLRFILDLFATGESDRLYASMSRGKLTGLMFLLEKKRLFYTELEVHYVATINGVPLDARTADYPRIRGTGTFLMAGAWLAWKEFYPRAHEIVLDAELDARHFYEKIGLEFRPPYGYVLKKPAGKLLLYIVAMAMNRRRMPEGAQKAVAGCIERQIRYLKKSGRTDDPKRKTAILAVSSCGRERNNRALADTVQQLLHRYGGRIPEGELLIKSLSSRDNGRLRHAMLKGASLVLAVCDPVFERHLEGVFHLESGKRIQAIETILAEDPFPERVIRVPPRAASEEELAWVHHREYIARVAETAGKRLSSLDPDTQTTAGSYAVAKLAAGGVFSLIDAVYSGNTPHCGIACIRPPGHHAEPGRAMGFCLFNNAALGAEYLRRRHGVQRVLIADIDVHHGNGTQAVFYDRRDVLFFSVHQFPCYPGTGKLSEIGVGAGEGYSINVPLSKGRGDKDYAKILHFFLVPVARRYRPDFILVSLGFDLYRHDPLGRMNVTPDGYALMTHMLKNLAGEICQGRIVFVMEGGYSAEGIRGCGRRVFQELAGLPTLACDTIRQAVLGKPESLPELRKAMEVHRKYWPPPG